MFNHTAPDRAVGMARRALVLAQFGLLTMLPMTTFATDAGNGQHLYSIHCAGCHGIDGISVMPRTPNLVRFELIAQTDQNLIDVIQTGRDMMPPYLGILKESEVLDVISYLRALH